MELMAMYQQKCFRLVQPRLHDLFGTMICTPSTTNYYDNLQPYKSMGVRRFYTSNYRSRKCDSRRTKRYNNRKTYKKLMRDNMEEETKVPECEISPKTLKYTAMFIIFGVITVAVFGDGGYD